MDQCVHVEKVIGLISQKIIITISKKRISRKQDLKLKLKIYVYYILNKILSWQLTEIVPFLLDWIGNILSFNPVVCIAIQGLEWPPLKSIIFGCDCQGDDASCTSPLLQGATTSFRLLFFPFLATIQPFLPLSNRP